MDLLLIRHAEAGERDPAQWPDDDLRPLSPEGRRKQEVAARAMRKLGITFDFLVTSPLARARETADILADVYAWTEPPLVDGALDSDCTPAGLLRLLAKFPPDAAVACVGHEPSFSRAAAALVSRSGDTRFILKKSGVIGIAFDGAPEAGKGALGFVLKPGHLKRIK